jgi:hypothetical protein
MYRFFLPLSLAILAGCGTNTGGNTNKNAPIFVRPEPNNAVKSVGEKGDKVFSGSGKNTINEPKVLSGSGKNTKYFIVSESDLRLIAGNTNENALNKLLGANTNESGLNINENKQKVNDSEPNKPTAIPLQLIEIPAEPQKKEGEAINFYSILIFVLLFAAAYITLFYFYKRNNQK